MVEDPAAHSVLLRSFVFNYRLASASLHITPSANITTKSQEEKFGLPPRPRKPLTPFFRFLAETRPKVTKENPKLSTMEVVKVGDHAGSSGRKPGSRKINFRFARSSGQNSMKARNKSSTLTTRRTRRATSTSELSTRAC